MLDLFFGPLVMAAAIRLMAPILFVAMGGAFGHKANVLNIGLESFMAVSAFFAMYGSFLFQNALIGLLFGVASSALASCIFAVFVLYFKSNPVVIGIAMNLAGWGATSFLLDALLGTRGVFIDPGIKSFQPMHIPLLEGLPYAGQVFSGQNLLVYLAILIVVLSYLIMYKTPFGLRLRGVGIKAAAAQTVGVNADRYKWTAILMGGILSGFGGSFLTIGGSSMFTENISAGKGFLALAAIMVGDGNPVKTALACVVFGYTQALSVTLQSMGLPSQIVISVPYLITIMIMFGSAVVSRCRYHVKEVISPSPYVRP